MTVTVPHLFVATHAPTDRVGGLAPGGAHLRIRLYDGDTGAERYSSDLVVPPSQSFELDLSGAVDIRPGDYGTADLTTPEGHRFTAPFAAFRVEVDIGGSHVTGVASLGAMVTAQVKGGDGKVKGSGQVEQVVHIGDAGLAAGSVVRWTLDLGRGKSVAEGDTLTVDRDDFMLSGDQPSASIVIPHLLLDYNPQDQLLHIEGPAATDLALDVTPPFGGTATRVVTTDATGQYRNQLTLDAGSQLALVYTMTDGARTRLTSSVEQARVAVHGPSYNLVGKPGEAFALALYSPTSTLKSELTGVVGGSSVGFGAFRQHGSDVPVEPGDRIVTTLGASAPFTVTVPDITTQVDVDQDVVSGHAPPGTTVVVVANASLAPVSRTVQADGSGRFQAPFAGAVDIQPGTFGLAGGRTDGGHLLFAVWTAPRLEVSLDDSEVQGQGAPEAPVSFSLRAGDGTAKGSGAATVAIGFLKPAEWLASLPPPCAWRVKLLGSDRLPAKLQRGDVLSGTVGEDGVALTIPPIDLDADAGTDLVAGRTQPNAHVTL
jgi:hypothetical protein